MTSLYGIFRLLFNGGVEKMRILVHAHVSERPGKRFSWTAYFLVLLCVLPTISGCLNPTQNEVNPPCPIFVLPDRKDEAMGSRIIWNETEGRYEIPEFYRYEYSESEQAWVVSKVAHPIFGWAHQNVIGLVPIRFVEGLMQPLDFALSWELMTGTGETLYQYTYPTNFNVDDPSQVTGVDAVWDLWHQVEEGVVLPEGRYKTRLTIEEESSGEILMWYFHFIVVR